MYYQVVLGEESYDSLYSNEERNEFLFRIFSHVVLGGPVNQVSHTHTHTHTHIYEVVTVQIYEEVCQIMNSDLAQITSVWPLSNQTTHSPS